jgi:hypothetical protein
MSLHKPGWYKLGRCKILISIDNEAWHLSISCEDCLPSYKEIKDARYQFLPDDIHMAEIFPPKDEFVNLHPFCRHLWQIEIDESNYPIK